MDTTRTPGITSETIVDELQTIDPNAIREFIQERRDQITHPDFQNKVLNMLEELVDLVDHSGFLNTVREERMNHVVDGLN